MRIYLIVAEEPFFHPRFVEEIIREKGKEVVGITTVSDISPKKSFWEYLKWQWNFLGSWPFLYFGAKTILYKFFDFFSRPLPLKKFYSVAAVTNYYKIPLYKAESVNNPLHSIYLRKKRPDVIISAQGQIFKKELLRLPKFGCLNRHSALLPKYGGLWPVFWAMLYGEKKIGVSVHTMEEKIDHGKILARREIPVSFGDSMSSLYQKAFGISAEVTLEALEKIGKKPLGFIPYNPQEASYFSLPKAQDARLFRQKGLKFI